MREALSRSPSSHGVISSNAMEAAGGYGVWINARGRHGHQNVSLFLPEQVSGPEEGRWGISEMQSGEVKVPSEPRDHLSTHATAAAELFASVWLPVTRYLQRVANSMNEQAHKRGSCG